jgi:hypothetical protein
MGARIIGRGKYHRDVNNTELKKNYINQSRKLELRSMLQRRREKEIAETGHEDVLHQMKFDSTSRITFKGPQQVFCDSLVTWW